MGQLMCEIHQIHKMHKIGSRDDQGCAVCQLGWPSQLVPALQATSRSIAADNTGLTRLRRWQEQAESEQITG
jgi:hypothetical protein